MTKEGKVEVSRHSGNQANEDVRFERRDVRLPRLLAAAAGLVVLMAVVSLAMAGLFRLLAGRSDRALAAPSRVGVRDVGDELKRLRAREESLLSSFGWVSREEAVVRIPIERAMDLAIDEARESDEPQ